MKYDGNLFYIKPFLAYLFKKFGERRIFFGETRHLAYEETLITHKFNTNVIINLVYI